MNRIYVILIAALAIMQACGGIRRVEKKPQVTTTPEKQKLFVDQKTDPYTVQVNYALNIPEGYVPSCARLIYVPAFVASGHEYALTPVVVTGKNYSRLDERRQFFHEKESDYPEAMHFMGSRDSMQIAMSQTVPFELWMPGSKLVAKITLEACDREKVLYNLELADGMVYLPKAPGPVIVQYVKKEVEKKEEGFAYFRYPVNGYSIDPELFNNLEQLQTMTGLIRKVMSDTSAKVNRIVITGICSPDGPWEFNENLAKKRAENIRNYLVNHKHIDNDLLDVKYIAEDWGGLQKLIENSDLIDKRKALKIIDKVSNPEQRETALRKLPDFTYIKENLYPKLRKVSYEIYYTVKEMIVELEPE